MSTHLVIPDQHAHPEHNNNRADWLAQLIIDVQPDVVINIGDAADMPSLASYDKGKRAFQGRAYKKDIDAHLDFQERLWSPVKARKKKLPYRIFIEGNHEHRIERALDLAPELVGTIGFGDLETSSFYNDTVRYQGGTPGVIEVDGIHYSHFFVSGVMGRPIGGEHPAYSLISKQFTSCTAGHLHTVDYSVRTTVGGNKVHGLVCGVYQDYDSPWAGEVNHLWWRGVVIKRNVSNGSYDPEFVSIEALKNEYGND